MHVNKEPSNICCDLGGFATCFMLVSCLAYSVTLKMEATCSSKTLVDFQRTTWHYIPEDRTLGWVLCVMCFPVDLSTLLQGQTLPE
jgi:hypothetical protein